VDATEILRRDAPLDDKNEGTYPEAYEEIPYTLMVEILTLPYDIVGIIS
jgi:hypothetical protein